MSRTDCNQARQRARQRQKRRFRGPVVSSLHGERSQSGVKVRSQAGWRAYGVRWKARVAKAVADDEMREAWRVAAATKRVEAAARAAAKS